MSDCPALSYPRTLPSVLDAEDLAHLASIYSDNAHRWSGRSYYNLLHYVAATPHDTRSWAVLRKIEARVAREFGGDGTRFVMINDFFSYRASGVRIFPEWHQDTAFWLNGEVCTGFNLWILLRQRGGLNRSFELYDTSRNEQFYRDVYQGRQGRQTPGARTVWPASKFASSFGAYLGGMKRRGRALPTASRVELAPGDALVLRQPEIHRTDTGALEPTQWRLALGFKFIERLPLVELPDFDLRFGRDWRSVEARFPELLPPLQLGRPWPTVYNRSLVGRPSALRGRSSWMGVSAELAQRELSRRTAALDSSVLLCALLPPTFLVAVLCFIACSRTISESGAKHGVEQKRTV